MKYPIIRKRIGSMILTLAVALTMMVTALPFMNMYLMMFGIGQLVGYIKGKR